MRENLKKTIAILFGLLLIATSVAAMSAPSDLKKTLDKEYGYDGAAARVAPYANDIVVDGVTWKLTDTIRTSPVSGEAFIYLDKPIEAKELKKLAKSVVDAKGKTETINLELLALVDNTHFEQIPVWSTIPHTSTNETPYSDQVITGFDSKLVEANAWLPIDSIDEKTTIQNLKLKGTGLNASKDYDWKLGDLPWAWWNTTWQYKQAIVINTTTGTTWSNFQVHLNVTYQAGMIASGEQAFCDLRFVNGSEDTELQAWLQPEYTVAGKYANVWVKFNQNITTTSQTFYMYYQNTSTINCPIKTNGENVFDLFDDFNDASINTTKWQTGGSTVTESGGYVVLTDTAASAPFLISYSVFSKGYEMWAWAQMTGGAGNLNALGLTNTAAGSCYNTGAHWSYLNTWTEKLFVSGNPYNQNLTGEVGINYTFIVGLDNGTATRFIKRHEYTYGLVTNYYFTTVNPASPLNVSFCAPANAGGTDIIHVDSVFVRKATGNTGEVNSGYGAPILYSAAVDAPVVSLISPASTAYNNSNPIIFTYKPSSGAGFLNCSIWGNWSGTFALNNTNASTITNNSNNFISVAGIPNGYYKWGVNCYDAQNPSLNTTNATYFIGIDRTAPVFTWNSQYPADINSLNMYNQILNITFTATDTVGVNNTSVIFWHAVNTTINPNGAWLFINGTNQPFWSNTTTSQGNVSSYWYYNATDREIYPSTNNLDFDVFDSTVHSAYVLSSGNDVVKTRLFNISSSLDYEIEFMANASAPTVNPLRVYYCNSSYSTGSISTSSFCSQFGTVSAALAWNHTHSIYLSHALLPMPIVNGFVGSVKVTNESFFALRGVTGAGSWSVWEVATVTRPDQTRTTTNNGVSWSNRSSTIDLHAHGYSGWANYTYMVQSCDWLGNCANSTMISDTLNESVTRPTSPNILNPNATTMYYSSTIPINFTASVGGTGLGISNYFTSIYYYNGTFARYLGTNTSALGLYWNTALDYDDNYTVRVTAVNSAGLNGTGVSDVITIDNTAPTLTINTPANNTAWQAFNGLTLNGTCTDTNPISSVTTNSTIWSQYLTASPFNFTNQTMIAPTNFTIAVSCNDSLNNTATSWITLTIDRTAPAIVMTTPANNTNASINYQYFNFTVTDTYNVTSCVMQWTNGTNSTLAFTPLTENTAYCNINQSVSATGIFDFTVWAFDNAGNYNNTSFRWTFVNGAAFSVTALMPIDGQSGANPILFGAIAKQDYIAFANCSLIWDGALIYTDSAVVNNTIYYYTATNLTAGAHYWSIQCFDVAGNNVTSGTRGLTVQNIIAGEVGGSDTGGGLFTPYINNTVSQATALISSATSNVDIGHFVKSSTIQIGDNLVPMWAILILMFSIAAFATLKQQNDDYQITNTAGVFIALDIVTAILVMMT
jgi:hypothetical protein